MNVDWNAIRGWLYTGQSDEDVLKAFIRTQIYRPMFFRHDDYVNFTHDESKYKCRTMKFYVDHEGIERLLYTNGGNVNQQESGLVGIPGKYTVDGIRYYADENRIEYYIHYDPIQIIDDKFVYGDVEFYAVREDDGSITCLYFNEFHRGVQSTRRSV